MIWDELMPEFDTSDEVAIVVNADTTATWHALLDVDLIDVGKQHHMAGLLGAVRALPEAAAHLLHGKRPPAPPETLRIRDLSKLDLGAGGWVMLEERPFQAIALGLVGKFWKPVIEFVPVTAEAFASFDTPGYARTIYAFECTARRDGTTLLRAVMRTDTTDEHARKWFRRYWTLGVGSGAHVLVNGLLDLVREAAEAESGQAPGSTGSAEAPREQPA